MVKYKVTVYVITTIQKIMVYFIYVRGDYRMFSETLVILNELEVDSAKNDVKKLRKILDSTQLTVPDFFEIADSLDRIISVLKNEDYYWVLTFVNSLSDNLLELERYNDTENVEQIGLPHLTIILINLKLSIFLEELGLCNAAYNALSKTKDPWIKPFDFITREGDVSLKRCFEVDELLNDLRAIFPVQIRAIFTQRAYISFSLASQLGNINEEARAVFNQYKFIVKKTNLELIDIKFYTNYLDLYYSRNLTKESDIDEVIDILKKAYFTENNTNSRMLIASSIAKVLHDKEWIIKALQEKDSHYWPEYFEMLIRLECFEENPDEQLLLNVFWDFLNLGANSNPTRMMFDLFKQKHSSIYILVLLASIKKHNYEFAMLVSYNWNSFKPDNREFQQIHDKNICILLPNLLGFEGVIFFVKFNVTYRTIPLYTSVKMSEIFELKNIIEESWHVLTGEKVEFEEDQFENSRRQVQASVKYIEKISEFISLSELINHFKDIPKDIDFEYIETTWLNIPILPLLSISIENRFYVSTGYSSPNVQKIKKALIWLNSEGLSISNFEYEEIIKLLNEYDIEFDTFRDVENSKDIFLEKYADESYDLIWVISHGQFNFENPPYSYFYISPNEIVSSWELQNIEINRTTKRHLILNTCYSGCVDVRHQSMGFIGLAPSLTNKTQNVVGHLWFVRDLASAVFGTLFLSHLLEGKGMSESLSLTLVNMQNDNYFISELLESIADDNQLIDRVRYTSLQLKEPFYSMSALMFK